MNPIGRLDFGSGGAISSRLASNTNLNCASYFLSSASSLRARSTLEASRARRRTKAPMISMLTCTARLLRSYRGKRGDALLGEDARRVLEVHAAAAAALRASVYDHNL